MRRLGLASLVFCWSLGLGLATPGLGAETESGTESGGETPILLRADEVRHDEEHDVLIAHGNVEITQGARVLLADTVTYNQRADLLSASGNVVLMEPTGEVAFADYMTLTDDMREGVVRHIHILMEDDSRLAAVSGTRKKGVFSEFQKAVFSPCDLCKEDPTRAPLWQLKSMSVAHDQNAREIEYKDAFFEFFGVPLLYTPYLSHPDPTVKRRSGLLAPSYGSSTELGLRAQVPYYFNIAPDKDATFAPIFTSKEGVVLAGEYRQHFTDGEVSIAGSITEVDERQGGVVVPGQKEIRGHVNGKARFDLDPTWRTGLDVFRSTDDTYLRRYDLCSEDTLTTHAFLEGFRGRNYASVNTYLFQGLRETDDPDETPLILPMIDYRHVGKADRHGARWSLDANVLSLTRKEGADSHRLSVKPGWQLAHTADAGYVTTLSASLQMDGYLSNDVTDPTDPGGELRDGFAGRAHPQVMLDWRYPFIREDGEAHQMIEPIITVVAAPNGGNSAKISNEDGQNFEFDTTNLLSANRFTGLDRVEGGQRVNYGLKLGVFGAGGGSTSIFFGQSFRLRDDTTFLPGSGLEHNLSDFVGEVEVSPISDLNVIYRSRLNKDDLLAERSELEFGAGPPALHVDVNYFFIRGSPTNPEFGDREELTTAIRSKITKNWLLTASNRRDFELDDTLYWSAGIGYADECIDLLFSFTRSFTQDRDVKPANVFFLRIILKHLGEVAL
ncbi:MAG: LPS-assembly protein LptD [Alphaproteobacteria bacterium]|nr:LPS-assembly protein LptD [Alphaproteobacteria bacterium]